MRQDFVLDDARIVVDEDFFDGHGRNLRYHDPSKSICNGCLDANKVENDLLVVQGEDVNAKCFEKFLKIETVVEAQRIEDRARAECFGLFIMGWIKKYGWHQREEAGLFRLVENNENYKKKKKIQKKNLFAFFFFFFPFFLFAFPPSLPPSHSLSNFLCLSYISGSICFKSYSVSHLLVERI